MVMPPESMARARAGSPQQHLVTPVTSTPRAAHMATTAAAFARTILQSTLIVTVMLTPL